MGRRVRRPLETYLKHLVALEGVLAPATVEALLDLQESFAVTASRVAQLLNAPAREADEALKDRRFVKLSLGDEEGYTTAGKWEELKRFATAAVAAHHKSEPLSPGLEMEALRERLPYRSQRTRVSCAGRPAGARIGPGARGKRAPLQVSSGQARRR